MVPDVASISELFSAFGPVSVRRMFGGVGVYADGVMFAIGHGGIVYLKADEHSAAAFDREGAGPFVYMAKGGRQTVMSYRRLPDRLYDDPEELAVWAREAVSVAHRAALQKPRTDKGRGSRRGLEQRQSLKQRYSRVGER
jgi:DNA transformation protein